MFLIFRCQKDKAFCSFKRIFLKKTQLFMGCRCWKCGMQEWVTSNKVSVWKSMQFIHLYNTFTNGQKKQMWVTLYEHFWRLEHKQSFQKKHRCSWQDSRCVDAKSGLRSGLSDWFAVLVGIQGGGKELYDHVLQQESLFEPRNLRRQEASASSTDFHQVSQKLIFTSWHCGFYVLGVKVYRLP